MGWKKFPYWLRSGIIGGIIFLAIYNLLELIMLLIKKTIGGNYCFAIPGTECPPWTIEAYLLLNFIFLAHMKALKIPRNVLEQLLKSFDGS
jgi:hypothetical protein